VLRLACRRRFGWCVDPGGPHHVRWRRGRHSTRSKSFEQLSRNEALFSLPTSYNDGALLRPLRCCVLFVRPLRCCVLFVSYKTYIKASPTEKRLHSDVFLLGQENESVFPEAHDQCDNTRNSFVSIFFLKKACLQN
jgi:hypothetical protein